MRMVSTKQKAIYLATGGAAAATLVWLRYAKSAAGARRFMGRAGARAGKTLNGIQNSLSTIRKRTEEVDRIVHELVQIGSEQKNRAQSVVNESLRRLEQTTEVIRKNLTQSSNDITALLHDVRTAVEQSVATKPSHAA